MRQTSTALVSIGLALAAVVAASALANAKPRHHHHYRHVPHHSVIYRDTQAPLEVNKRSWLDPGPVAPVGSEQAYVTQSTIFAQSPDALYFPSRFHEDQLPRPLYVPGNMTHIFEFSTPRGPFE